MSALDLGAISASELSDELNATRRGLPFVIYRHADGRRRIVALEVDREQLTIGRRASNDVPIPWDPGVSRVHAQLQRIGGEWTLSDEGLSRNGSYLNGTRLTGRQRLRDRDVIRVGETVLLYRDASGQTDPTLVLSTASPPILSDIQRRVLLALARPYQHPDSLNAPASNQQIAHELSYSVGSVKAHLRVLFHKFGVDDLPQNRKRLKLVEMAFRTGTISPRDL